MRQSGQDIWWRQSSRLAATLAGGSLALCLVPWILGEIFDARSLLGMPVGVALFVLALPIIVLGLCAWYARQQSTLDHRYDVTGDPN